MRVYRIEVSAMARSDLVDIQSYIALDAPDRAMEFTLQVLDRIRTLERFPRRHRLVSDAASLGDNVRAMVMAPYKIYYTIDGDVVYVLHVRHAARGAPDQE